MNTDTRAMILHDSDAVCEGCSAPLPEDFLTREDWFADLAVVANCTIEEPDYFYEAHVRCPACW